MPEAIAGLLLGKNSALRFSNKHVCKRLAYFWLFKGLGMLLQKVGLLLEFRVNLENILGTTQILIAVLLSQLCELGQVTSG